MPRNIRNFWIDAYIDGKATNLSGGPKNKDGGIVVTISMRDNGSVKKVADITGYKEGDNLFLYVEVNGVAPVKIKTKR